MTQDQGGGAGAGARYATVFRRRLLGAACEVEVVVELSSLAGSAIVSMRQPLGAQAAFAVSLAQLQALQRALGEMKQAAGLLDALLPEAQDHQLNATAGAATAILVRPAGRPARYALSVGSFHREGELASLPLAEVAEAVKTVEALVDAAVAKVRNGRGRAGT